MIKPVSNIDLNNLNTVPESIVPEDHQFGAYQTPLTRIRWGSATMCLPFRPDTLQALREFIQPMTTPPHTNDVMIAEVQFCARHNALELDNGRRSAFGEGDLLAVVFGHRYATAQFFGEVPNLSVEYHLLSQGGVCGRVVSAPPDFDAPTILKPLGYFTDHSGQKVNLRSYALPPVQINGTLPPIILVVGSSMDAGKTTAASAVIRGLARGGHRVNAGKLTGTACRKDLFCMFDGGATRVLDFNSLGFASTARASEAELQEILDVMVSNLASDRPDYIVLEIADGIIQRETMMLLSMMQAQNRFQHLVLAVHDALSAPTCINLLKEKWNIEPSIISGTVTRSPLSQYELEMLTSCHCCSQEQLANPEIDRLLKPAQLQPRPIMEVANGEAALLG